MKKARKVFALLAAGLLLLSGCGRQDQESSNSAATAYIEMAQRYIDMQDYETAIEVLELGLQSVDDAQMKAMLDVALLLCGEETTESTEDGADIQTQVSPVYVPEESAVYVDENADEYADEHTDEYADENASEYADEYAESDVSELPMQESRGDSAAQTDAAVSQVQESGGYSESQTYSESQSFDISRYDASVTYWTTEGTSYASGGYILCIHYYEGYLGEGVQIEFNVVRAAPSGMVATAYIDVLLSEFNGNEIVFDYENDGFGHSGTVTLVFRDDSIDFTISNVEYTDPSIPEMWGLYENTGRLISNPGAYAELFGVDSWYS